MGGQAMNSNITDIQKLSYAQLFLESYLAIEKIVAECRILNGKEAVEQMFPDWNDLEGCYFLAIWHFLRDVDPALADIWDRVVNSDAEEEVSYEELP